MTSDQMAKKDSVRAINQALHSYRGQMYVTPPRKVIKSNNYAALSRLQIDQGVIALVHACNLSGGSVGDVDIYKLLRTYLHCDGARDEINAVVERHGI